MNFIKMTKFSVEKSLDPAPLSLLRSLLLSSLLSLLLSLLLTLLLFSLLSRDLTIQLMTQNNIYIG